MGLMLGIKLKLKFVNSKISLVFRTYESQLTVYIFYELDNNIRLKKHNLKKKSQHTLQITQWYMRSLIPPKNNIPVSDGSLTSSNHKSMERLSEEDQVKIFYFHLTVNWAAFAGSMDHWSAHNTALRPLQISALLLLIYPVCFYKICHKISLGD